MKITFSHDYVEIHTKDKVFVYDVTSPSSRIDAVDYAIARHKEFYPNSQIVGVKYTSQRSYTL